MVVLLLAIRNEIFIKLHRKLEAREPGQFRAVDGFRSQLALLAAAIPRQILQILLVRLRLMSLCFAHHRFAVGACAGTDVCLLERAVLLGSRSGSPARCSCLAFTVVSQSFLTIGNSLSVIMLFAYGYVLVLFTCGVLGACSSLLIPS
mgnify:CR=1 FL=1